MVKLCTVVTNGTNAIKIEITFEFVLLGIQIDDLLTFKAQVYIYIYIYIYVNM